jgi:uncharacterized membrane protein
MRAELRITLYMCMTVLTIAVQGYAQPQYTITDLGALQPSAIAGPWVVGVENGRPTRLNLDTMEKVTLATHGMGGVAWAVIARGEAAGTITIQDASGPMSSAAWWDIDGQVHLLDGPLPSAAYGFAANGTVVGDSGGCPDGMGHPMRWRNGGTDACLATPRPAGNLTSGVGLAVDLNDCVWGINHEHELKIAMVWLTDGTFRGIPNPVPVLGSQANAVSPDGTAIGESGHYCAGCSSRGWIGTLDGGTVLLPHPTGKPFPVDQCTALAINSHHASVGTCRADVAGGVTHVVLWPNATTATDLNLLTGLPLQTARGINDDGKIVGVMSNGHGFLLTPMPPAIAIILNQTDFAPGQTLRMALDMHNPGPMLTTDEYVGIILPDREQVVFLTNLSPLEGQLTALSNNPRLFARLLQGVSWPANLHATQENYWVYTRSGLEANGTYYLVVAWTKPNSLEDGRIDEGDILALDWKAFRFTGPASTPAAEVQEIRARHATE